MGEQLSEAARAFLAEPRFGVLGINRPGEPPHLSVMWFALEGDEIMMNTLVGRVKDGALREDPRAALCVEDGYRYVTLYGSVRMLEDRTTAQADIARLARLYEPEADAERMIANFRKQQRVTIRMAIERVAEHL
jgi:PPOX class probable F420-dependent enzyme